MPFMSTDQNKENTLITDSGQELIIPDKEEASVKKYNVPLLPEDYDPLEEEDEDFPTSETDGKLPAASMSFPVSKNVLSEKKQSVILGWSSDDVKIVNRQTGIFLQMPMVCNGTHGCTFGKICPVTNRDQFIGKSCPLEIMELFKHFSGYVRDQNINPEDFTDLQLVADLCRQHLIMWRTDMMMRLENEISEEIGVVVQRTGTPYYRPIINKNRELQTYARSAIHSIYKQLVATRSERNKNKDNKTADSIAVMLSKITQNSNKI